LPQWAKNALVFVPLILGGQAANPAAWAAAVLGFVALGLVASATYLLNDLWDLADDRRHWTKRNRPLASGRLPIPLALALIPVGLLIGLSLAALAGRPALAVTLGYLALTLAYSFRLKREPVVDAVTLGGLFTLRLGLGIALAAVRLSPWLLVFAMFLFTSLALAKRHVELGRLARHGRNHACGRGYRADDGPVVLGMGLASAFVAVAVMVLYLIHEAFGQGFYAAPGWLWTFPLMLTLWIGRIWLLAGRGELDDDPVIFALRDRTSLAYGGCMLAAFAAAAFGPASW
jgi:4-hydroxybenzoate polyprenyltransferase